MISFDPALRAHHDFEGGGALNIKLVGAYRWMRHPSQQCWCMSWRIGNAEPVSRWHPGDPDPVRLLNHVHAGGTMVAHNAGFERDYWNLVIRGKYCPHWPELKLEQQDCTLARASTLGLPAALEFVTPVLHLTVEKDIEGKKLMLKMSKPRKIVPCAGGYSAGDICVDKQCAFCGGIGETYVWWNSPENISRLGEYCDQDVLTECAVDDTLLRHTERERAVWEMDQRINMRGIKLDRNLIEHMLATVAYSKVQMDQQMHDLTRGFVKSCGQVAKIVEWINACGVACSSVAKGEQAELLIAADATDIPEIRQVIELRAIAAKSSTAKLKRMLDCMSEDDRARYLLFYHGTIGGRWAGRLIQPHNLYQVDEEDGDDIARTIDLSLSANTAADTYAAIDTIIGPPMVAIAKSMRSMFVADTGKRFVGGDKSNIEGRLNAWFSGEQWKLDAFRAYDRGVGPDLYRLAYSRSFGVPVDEVRGAARQVGKVQELSLGYQGAVGAVVKMAKNKGIDLRVLAKAVRAITPREMWDKTAADYAEATNKHGLTEEIWTAVSIIVKSFRESNPNITQGWWDLQDGALEAVANPTAVVGVFNGRIRYMASRGFLWCSLPSSRLIAYCEPRLKEQDSSYVQYPDGKRVLVADLFPLELSEIKRLHPEMIVKRIKKQVWYEGHDSEKNIWSSFPLYGGMQCAHVVSATARDALVDDMFECERRGYNIVLDVHDSILTEMDYGAGTKEEIQEIMSMQPRWIDDQALPLAAKVWEGPRFLG